MYFTTFKTQFPNYYESLAKFGCRAPYGTGAMDEICTDQEKSQEAMQFFENMMAKRFTIKECPYPCTFIKTIFTDKNPRYSSEKSQFRFSKLIKVTKSRYSYGELELLAEFGGYVGLFLGISVFNLKDVFNKILQVSCHS